MEREVDGRVTVMVEWRTGERTRHNCEMLHNKAPKLVSLRDIPKSVINRMSARADMRTWQMCLFYYGHLYVWSDKGMVAAWKEDG